MFHPPSCDQDVWPTNLGWSGLPPCQLDCLAKEASQFSPCHFYRTSLDNPQLVQEPNLEAQSARGGGPPP
jgi:hypothetical protein